MEQLLALNDYWWGWGNLLFRWLHVIASMAWIGASFYFIALDNHLEPPKDPDDAKRGIGGEAWEIHGGGFYRVEKFRVAPERLPEPLHWFKWEAYTTWLSGFALFIVVYYSHATSYLIDPTVAEVVRRLKRRRGGGDELLAYRRGRRWMDLRSEDINGWLKEATGEDVSAKEFRTWGATVLAAVALAISGDAPATKTGRKRVIKRAIDEVARYLGNTPAVARASYIDPRVFDRYRDGETIDRTLVAAAAGRNGDATAIQGPVEEAVLDLLE